MKFIRILVITFAIALLVKVFAFTSGTIPFSGMENTLYEGERILVNKWSYGFRIPFSHFLSYYRICKKRVSKNDIVVFNNPSYINKKVHPEFRETFISRCIGLPGDTLMLDQNRMVTTKAIESPDYKSLYSYPKAKEEVLVEALKTLDIKNNELISYRGDEFIRNFSHYEIYLIKQRVKEQILFTSLQMANQDEIHPFIIPAKGMTIPIYPWNKELLQQTIRQHEDQSAEIRGDSILIEGKPITSYTFSKDYYWMASNNQVNLHDSRLFGFVPEDYIIGKASIIWFSKETGTNLLEGYRWNRFFQTIK